MLLIAVFAIYVLVTGRVRITRTVSITGTNARVFGALLLALPIGFQSTVAPFLSLALPRQLRAAPYPQAIYVTLFAAVALCLAFVLRDKPIQADQSPQSPNEPRNSGDL